LLVDYVRLERDVLGGLSPRDCRFAVVGLGALGSEVCRLLGQIGAKLVLLIDPDYLCAENMPYGVMYRVGREKKVLSSEQRAFKSDAIAWAGERIFPDTTWVSRAAEVADVGLKLLRDCDLVFSCTDNVLARAETSYLARLLGKIMVDGGLKGEAVHEGRVSFFPADRSSACYLCQLSESRRAEVLSFATARSLGCAPLGVHAIMTATPMMASLIAAQMTDLGIRHLADRATDNNDASAWIYRMPPHDVLSENVRIAWSATCPWHDFPVEGELTELDDGQSVRQMLRSDGERRKDSRKTVLELIWPLCLRARCQSCGAEQKSMRRVALIRRSGMCTVCGVGGRMEPLECLRALHEEHPLADMTARQLGFPSQHLFWCRPELFSCEDGWQKGSA